MDLLHIVTPSWLHGTAPGSAGSVPRQTPTRNLCFAKNVTYSQWKYTYTILLTISELQRFVCHNVRHGLLSNTASRERAMRFAMAGVSTWPGNHDPRV